MLKSPGKVGSLLFLGMFIGIAHNMPRLVWVYLDLFEQMGFS